LHQQEKFSIFWMDPVFAHEEIPNAPEPVESPGRPTGLREIATL
jgi:hypothetical protein